MKTQQYIQQAGYRFAVALIVLAAVFAPGKSFSNNLVISGLSVNQGAQQVSFNISWDHSWRISTSPANWDAAWVFVKFRDCSSDANLTQFTHGLVSNVSFSGTTPFEASKSDGTGGIDGNPDNTGVMIRNSGDAPSGSVSGSVTITLSNLPTSGTIDTRVFGVEMVFIPSGAYYLGDGNGTTQTNWAYSANGPNSFLAALIQSDSAQTVYQNSSVCCSYPAFCPSNTCAMGAAFPKGFNAFYMMKYEISQGQYADFLNTLPTIVNSRFPGQYNVNRNTINNIGNPPTQYTASRPDRACNFLSWADVGGYLQWAALRPLTELEYEKACRGTNGPSTGEYAWGSSSGTQAANNGISGTEDGTETITTPGANFGGNASYSSGDGGNIQGPLRCGIFATASTTTRQQSGASFYGVLDLSGNVDEYYVGIAASLTGAVSNGGVSRGNGSLNSNGDLTMSNWPAVTPGNTIVTRGGGLGVVPVSYNINTTSSRSYARGGRGGR